MLSDTFPVECSILSSTALCERIVPEYGLRGSRNCHLLQHGDNDTYLVHHEQQQYVLRVWSKDPRPHTEIEAELELLSLLAQQHIPVVQPLKRDDGRYLSAVTAPEGERFIGFFRYAPGTPPDTDITAEQSHAYGRAVAAMHHVFDTLTQPYPRPHWNLDRLLDAPIAAILPSLTHLPARAHYLSELAETLRARLSTLPTTSPLYGLCHSDLHKNNLLWTSDQQLTILDFDLCGYGWRAYDLAILFWSTRYLPQAKTVRDAYLDGYSTLRTLQPIELQVLPYFVAIRDIYVTATKIRHARQGVAGSDMITDEFFDGHFIFLQRWMEAITNNTYQAL